MTPAELLYKIQVAEVLYAKTGDTVVRDAAKNLAVALQYALAGEKNLNPLHEMSWNWIDTAEAAYLTLYGEPCYKAPHGNDDPECADG